MQEPMPDFIPPDAFGGARPLYDPNGPVGKLLDPSRGWLTIGELAQAGVASPFGYMVVGDGILRDAFEHYPHLNNPGPAVAQNDALAVQTNANLMAALLLMMF